jgi:hypothetical protein
VIDLKQRVIENIRKEGAFDMDYYGSFEKLASGNPEDVDCGTACCLAGHIVAAAAQLGLSIPEPDSKYDHVNVPNSARKIWCSQYGLQEASRLEFNGAWGNLQEVTAEEVIGHINGDPPIYHDGKRSNW